MILTFLLPLFVWHESCSATDPLESCLATDAAMGVPVIVAALLISGIVVLAFLAIMFLNSNCIRALRSLRLVVTSVVVAMAALVSIVVSFVVTSVVVAMAALVSIVVSFVVTSVVVAMTALVSIFVSFVITSVVVAMAALVSIVVSFVVVVAAVAPVVWLAMDPSVIIAAMSVPVVVLSAMMVVSCVPTMALAMAAGGGVLAMVLSSIVAMATEPFFFLFNFVIPCSNCGGCVDFCFCVLFVVAAFDETWWWLRLVEENICSESILLAKGVRTWDSIF
jgi:hypothetical protein